MADALFPVEESPEFLDDNDTYDVEYRPTVAWDYEKGDFVLNGKGQMEICSGEEGFQAWCIKMAYTERYNCLAYPEEIGVELDDALAEPTEGAVETALERTITEALMTNPRTEYVGGFSFEWNGDNVYITFTVKGLGDEEFDVQI